MTADFRLGKLAFDLPYNQAWNTTSLPEEKFFQGTFSYLAHGAQSFVFKSEDGEWTLKIFRYDRWIHPWRKFFRNEVFKRKKRLAYNQKIDRLFCAAKLAFEEASDLTGLSYVHLNCTKATLPTVVLKDQIGRTHHLDLNHTYFVIQHRAKPLLDGFLEAIETNDREKFKRLCRSFKNLLHTRTCRGICNSDTKVHLNFGFWGERAIEWDFGNYWIDRNMKTEEDREFEKSRFIFKPALFLSKYPEWAALYRKEIEE